MSFANKYKSPFSILTVVDYDLNLCKYRVIINDHKSTIGHGYWLTEKELRDTIYDGSFVPDKDEEFKSQLKKVIE